MRHKHERARLVDERAREPLLHRRARDRVERAERLVEEERGAPGQEGAQEGDPLAHAPGQLARIGALEVIEAETLEERRRRPARLALRGARALERESGVGQGVAPREQQVGLRHERARLRAPDDPPRVRLLKPREQLEQGRLPAAGGADDRHGLALRHFQIETVECHNRPEAAVEPLRPYRRCSTRSSYRHDPMTPFAGITPQVQRVSAGL